MVHTVLSIVVPTHNRADYAISCIEAVLAFPDSDLQLVVTDTSTDRRLHDMLHSADCPYLADSRIVYVKIDEPSNLTKNHNAAMDWATGEFICIIGDDDCITQGAIDAARWASVNGVPVVSQRISTTYAWPDFQSRLARGGHAARLYVPREAGTTRWRDAQADLRSALTRAFQGTDDMPRCYHGVVRRDLLQNVKDRTGSYFHGSSPDLSGAISLACQLESYCETDIPLTIPGVSGGSNSGRSAMNTHKGELTSESQTSSFVHQGWVDGVPKFFSVETVWAHAGLATLREMKPELVSEFNYARLLALCSVRHPEYQPRVEEAKLAVEKRLNTRLSAALRKEKSAIRIERLLYITKRMLKPTVSHGRKYFSGQQNIAKASHTYSEYAKNRSIHFSAPE